MMVQMSNMKYPLPNDKRRERVNGKEQVERPMSVKQVIKESSHHMSALSAAFFGLFYQRFSPTAKQMNVAVMLYALSSSLKVHLS